MEFPEEQRVFLSRNGEDSRPSKIMQKSKISRQLLALISGALTILSVGFHSGWSSPSLVKLQAEDSNLPVTSSQGGWIVFLMSPGCLAGVFFSSLLVDKWGRKRVILLSSLPYITGCILIAFAKDYRWLYAARFSVGIGYGLGTMCMIIYLGEVAEDRIRGTLGAMFNNMANTGVLLAYCVGPWVDRIVLAGVGGAIPIIFLLIFVWMPESPYFFVMHAKTEEARDSLRWLRGKQDVSDELKTVEQNVELSKANTGSFKELFFKPQHRRALIVAIGVNAAQEFSGVGPIIAYSQLIFEASGAQLSSSISIIAIAVMQLISGYSATFTADLFGRRKLLMISTLGSGVFLSLEAVYFQLQSCDVDVTSIFWLPVTAIIGFVICYAVGLGVLPSPIISEIFSQNVKAKAVMLSVVMAVVGTGISNQLYQIVSDAYGIQYSFGIFSALCACSTVFVYCVVPETRNRSLQEIQDDFVRITKPKATLNTL